MKNVILFITLFICQNLYCQIFDGELLNNVSERENKKETIEQVPIGSPQTKEINTYSNLGNTNPKIQNNNKKLENEQGLSLEEVSKIGANNENPNSFNETPKTLPNNMSSNNLESKSSSNDLVYIILFVLFLAMVIIVFVVYQNSIIKDNIENENPRTPYENKIPKEVDASKILIELEKIENLKKLGTITDNEFEKLKKYILNKI
jgi:hypothetical protein